MRGKPATVVPRVAQEAAAPHRARQRGLRAVRPAPGRGGGSRRSPTPDIELRRTGSPYAVAPGTLINGSGSPFQVFTPFHRAWLDHGVHDPASAVRAPVRSTGSRPTTGSPWQEPDAELVGRAGEKPARRAWQAWLGKDPEGVADYDKLHDVPRAGRHVAPVHRAALGASASADGADRPGPAALQGRLALARQIAWRDFFADTLFHRPDAVTQPIRPEFTKMPVDEPEQTKIAAERLAAWQQGRTGYPLVDAGMRQLQAEGWMHNRVRMVVASFLIKDLHIGWWHGADWFMTYLRDGDIAQNQLNWQWVAGCGTDPAPYFRIFNPITQSEKFDARRDLHPPLRARAGRRAGRAPARAVAGPGWAAQGYPAPIVDHASERKEALDRYAVVKG